MDIAETLRTIGDVGFPIVIAIYLLWFIFRKMDGFRNQLIEVKMGLHLILAKLDILDEYEKQIADYKRRKEESNG